MTSRWVQTLLLAIPLVAEAQTVHSVLPPKNELAITPQNFCAGFKNVFAITKQSIQTEVDFICPGGAPAPLLTTLLGSAFTGQGEPVIQTILTQEDAAAQTTQIIVAYAMKTNKAPAQTLLGEEKHVPVAYAGDPLTIRPKFGIPPLNSGDADTAFTVEQRTTVKAAVEFDETSIHDLKLYRLHPDNFDFFAAARTLRTPTEQFKKSVVLRGVMRDPNNPTGSIIITVLNFLMNSREEHERSVAAFSAFITADLKALYAEQSK